MKKLCNLINKERLFLISYIPFTFTFFLFVFLILRYPQVSSSGVKKGIELCFEVLIPSLYPFMVLSGMLVSSGIIMKKTRLTALISEKLFSMPFCAVSVFILSCLGGYPVGAVCIDSLIRKGSISKNEGKRMLSFSVNPSPAFVISTVGFCMLGSMKAGAIMYISIVLSSVLVGAFTGKFNRKSEKEDMIFIGKSDSGVWDSFIISVKNGAVSMGIICAFVVFFSCIFSLIDILPLNSEMKLFIRCILEITNGIDSGASVYSIPMLTFFLSFGGFCSLLQVLTSVSSAHIKLGHIVITRLLSAFLSGIICSILLKIFPVVIETFSPGRVPGFATTSYSSSVSAGMIIMTFLFIIGDSFVVEKKVDIEVQ